MSADTRSPRVYLKGEETTWEDDQERYLDWIEVKIRCDSHEQSQAVGKVVSLLKEHTVEEIAESVEGSA